MGNALGPMPQDPLERRRFEMDWNLNRFVGRRIKFVRYGVGMDQDHLARAAGFSTATLSRVEHGWRALTVGELIRIAIELERPVDFFIKPPPEPEIVLTGWEPLPRRARPSIFAEMAALEG